MRGLVLSFNKGLVPLLSAARCDVNRAEKSVESKSPTDSENVPRRQ